MANYPTPPGNRIATDVDGTQGTLLTPAGALSALSAAQMTLLNDDAGVRTSIAANSASFANPEYICYVFPEARSLQGVFVTFDMVQNPFINIVNIQWSPNTTNGQDGVWNTIASYPAGTRGTLYTEPGERNGIITFTAASATGIRYGVYTDAGSVEATEFNVYGSPVSPTKLLVWDPVLNQQVAPGFLDWSDIPQSSTDIRQFRIHNYASQTASNLTLSLEANTVDTPSQVAWNVLSVDGVNFSSSLNLGNLGPNSTTGILYLQRVTPANAQLGLTWLRMKATATFI